MITFEDSADPIQPIDLARPDRHTYAQFMATRTLDEVFGKDLVEVLPADVQTGVEGDPKEFDEATQTVLGSLRKAVSEARGEEAEQPSVLFGDTEGLERTLTDALRHAMAYGYIWGRLDQISDTNGTNETRMVKAKDLHKVVTDAVISDPEGTLLFSDVALIITQERNRLK